jgi:hypothetical protein
MGEVVVLLFARGLGRTVSVMMSFNLAWSANNAEPTVFGSLFALY